MNLRATKLRIALLGTLALFNLMTISGAASVDAAADEEELGKTAVKQVEKQVELIKDPAIEARLETIGRKVSDVARITTVPATYGSADLANFKYVFKLIDSKEINAFALPGGNIYVNKGLVDFVKSDDELAAVLAHETAHAAHHHTVKLVKKQSKMNRVVALLAAVGALSKMPSNDLANVLYGAQMVRVSVMNGYGQVAETDADRTAVTYMAKAGYDPAAMLTFLERLTKEVESKPQLPLGIFRTHPPYRERADTITAEMDRQSLPYDRGLIDKTRTAVACLIDESEKPLSEVRLAERSVFRPADTATSTSAERAAVIAETLTTALQGARGRPSVKISCEDTSLLINGAVILTAQPEDGVVNGSATQELVRRAAETVRFAMWCDHIVRNAPAALGGHETLAKEPNPPTVQTLR